MSDVVKTELPPDSALHSRIGPADFLDCYSVKSELPPREAARIIVDFPAWARFLLLIRKIVTTPFGLSSDGPVADDKLGPFPVESEAGHELIAGFDDKHLDFRIAVVSRESQIFLATWVHPHNIGGRLYLATILPFHIAISRNALARVGMQTAPHS